MAVDANTYFRGLRSYLNTKDYGNDKRDKDGRILLKEKVFYAGGIEKEHVVKFAFSGDVISFKLDQKKDPLFHFFDNDARPWSKRCDYVVFQRINQKINIYCIEFKSASLPDSLVDQLRSSEAWCKVIHSIVNLYTGDKKRLNLKKFVFSSMDDPSRFVDEEGYYKREHSIRHYHYDELTGLSLEDLDNKCPVLIG